MAYNAPGRRSILSRLIAGMILTGIYCFSLVGVTALVVAGTSSEASARGGGRGGGGRGGGGRGVEASGAVVAAVSWFAAVAVATVEVTAGATVEAMATALAACSAPSMAGWSVTNVTTA